MENQEEMESNVDDAISNINSLGKLKKFMKAVGSKFKLNENRLTGEYGFKQQIETSKTGITKDKDEFLMFFLVPEFKMNPIDLSNPPMENDPGGTFDFHIKSIWFSKKTKRSIQEPDWFKELKAKKEKTNEV